MSVVDVYVICLFSFFYRDGAESEFRIACFCASETTGAFEGAESEFKICCFSSAVICGAFDGADKLRKISAFLWSSDFPPAPKKIATMTTTRSAAAPARSQRVGALNALPSGAGGV